MAFGFTVVTAVLVAASVAFACVQTRGRMTVTGSLNTRSFAEGNGFHPGKGNVEYCRQPRPGAQVLAPTGFSPAQRPDVTVALSPAQGCNPLPAGSFAPGQPNVFADGNYDVMFCDGDVFQTNQNGVVKDTSSNPTEENEHGGCFFTDAVTDRATLMGTMVVAGGSGSGTYDIPFGAAVNGPNNYAGVSVRRTGPTPQPGGGPPHVNMAPISII
jgi:hypothetical protein